jgi:hypothetical protein
LGYGYQYKLWLDLKRRNQLPPAEEPEHKERRSLFSLKKSSKEAQDSLHGIWFGFRVESYKGSLCVLIYVEYGYLLVSSIRTRRCKFIPKTHKILNLKYSFRRGILVLTVHENGSKDPRRPCPASATNPGSGRTSRGAQSQTGFTFSCSAGRSASKSGPISDRRL